MHDVQALIARSGFLRQSTRTLAKAVVCELPQELALLPITRELSADFDALYQVTGSSIVEELHAGTTALATEISFATPVAFISTFYFGGDGGQDALVWHQGALLFSPSSVPYSDVWPDSPISRALRFLGVVAEAGSDEFDTVGLGSYRSTEKWAAYAQTQIL